MDNQQVPKADSKFQKIVRANYKKWKIRLLSKGGQKADSGGSPYKEKPDYKMGKSAPDMLDEEEQLNEIIVKRGDKFCLVSKSKTKEGKRKSLGCYPSREGAENREKQVQYFKHLKEEILKTLEEVLQEEKKKDDRCVRIAKRKYKAWPSAYASGAVVKCRQGKIWKGVSEGTEELDEEWSEKYKKSIDCKHPKGFSQKAHCQGRKKNEEIQLNEKCWEGYTQKGMKTMFGKEYPNCVKKKNEAKDPKVGTGKKPEGSDRRLYTDENPKDTVSVKFSTAEDIRDTLSKESFKSKPHARQSQIINLIHQRVRAAYENAKDPEVKSRLKTALEYAEKRKEASKKKTKAMKELDERKLGKPSSETNLGDWFKRKGTPGKGGGWVDCNTCRDGKCKPCGRQEGEKRSKYPRCRPTPSQCKGYKRRGDNLQKEE